MKFPLRISYHVTCLTLLLCVLCNGINAANINGDFSKTQNPNQPWTYGSTSTLNGPLTLYNEHLSATSGGTIDSWRNTANVLGTPSVWSNKSPADFDSGSSLYKSGWAGFHPGPDSLSVFRYTAPVAGQYSINVDFEGADKAGTTTQVFVMGSGGQLFSASILGFSTASRRSYQGVVNLTLSGIIDFVVYNGGNQQFFNDSTAIRGTVDLVPIPPALLLLSTAMAGLGLMRKRSLQRGRIES